MVTNNSEKERRDENRKNAFGGNRFFDSVWDRSFGLCVFDPGYAGGYSREECIYSLAMHNPLGFGGPSSPSCGNHMATEEIKSVWGERKLLSSQTLFTFSLPDKKQKTTKTL